MNTNSDSESLAGSYRSCSSAGDDASTCGKRLRGASYARARVKESDEQLQRLASQGDRVASRKLRNRESARRCRMEKEAQADSLRQENDALRQRLQQMEAKLREIAQENVILKVHLIQNTQAAAAALPTTAVGVAHKAQPCAAAAN